MADQYPSTSGVGGESSESMVELNIKTLDSQIYSFKVDKDILVSLFKEKIASEIGLPVGQQRLIFRGKVLKDDHLLSEYHVENGHTLHLVARQPSDPQPAPSPSSGETTTNNGNRGHDANATGPRNRMGQISHSVLLGTLNVGDQGEGIVPDLGRVIGAVLNSIGLGSQPAANIFGGVQPSVQFSAPVQTTQGNGTDGTRNSSDAQSQAGSQPQPGQALPGQTLPQVLQVPLGAAISVPSLNAPIPDSLHTLSEFMNRMELALSNNGNQPNQSPSNIGDLPTVELPSNARGLSTPEALTVILRHAQRLLSSHTVAALSHITGRLEQEGGSTDPTVRAQIQTESVQVGLAMQHLGALLLELGRTILTLRMGQSPAESYVNAGPAVYISPSGPNPIMVQPFPLQNYSLFGGPAAGPLNLGPTGPVGIGTVPRHVNIHIHTAVGTRASNTEGGQGEPVNRAGSGDSGQTRLPPDSVPLSTVMSEVNSRVRNFVDNMRGGNQALSGQSQSSSMHNPSVGSGAGNDEENNQPRKIDDNAAGEAHRDVNSKDVPSSSSVAPRSGGNDNPEVASAVPLGLGLGGLQPKRRSRQPGSSDGATSSTTTQNQQTRANGQQVLQSLASLANRRNPNTPSAEQLPPAVGGIMESGQMGGQGAGGQFDVSSVMSQVLHSPALNGLLSGVSEQTGVGSPDVLRNMLEQFTQNPAMRNTVNQIAQQFDSQDLGNMLSGFGRGQGGGLDLTSMVQQMMPIVSQALSGSTIPQQIPAVGPGPNWYPEFPERSYSRDERVKDEAPQIDLERVVQRIEQQNPPEEIFRTMVESAAGLYDNGSGGEQLVNDLCHEEGLASEFMEVLRHDLHQRLQGEKGPEEKL